MRTLTAQQALARAGATSKYRGQGLYWFVKVEWNDPIGPQYYSIRNFSPDPGVTVNPILQEAPACPSAIDVGLDGTAVSGSTTLVLRNEPLSDTGIEATLDDAVDIKGTVVTVYFVFDPRDGSALAEADWSLINTYVIDSTPKYTYGQTPQVSFALIDKIESVGGKSIGRLVSRDLFPDRNLPDRSLGTMIPIVYGAVDGAQAIAVVQGHVTELDGAIDDTATTIFVKSVEGFDANGGTIKIDGESMTYTDVTPGINSSFNGVTRGSADADQHSDGASVVEVLDLYEYILTDHLNDDVSNTRVNGKAVVASEVQDTLDGKDVTYLTLPALPTITEFANVSQTTRLDGETSEWADDGSTVDSYIRDAGEFKLVEDDATGAVDQEEGGVTFALFDPTTDPQSKDLSVTHSQDLSGRASFLTGLNLAISYQIIPSENFPDTIEDFPWDAWFITVTRDGVEIARSDVPKPSPIVIRGFLDRTAFLPGIEGSRRLFAKTGLGSQYVSGLNVLNTTLGGTPIYSGPSGTVGVTNWPDYSRSPLDDDETFRQSSLTGVKVASVSGTPTVKGVFQTAQLRLSPVFDSGISTFTKIQVEIEIFKANAVTGDFIGSLYFNDGRPTISKSTVLTEGDTDTIVLELESEFAVTKDGSGDTTDGLDTITNLSFDTKGLSAGDFVFCDAFDEGSTIATITGADSLQISSNANGAFAGVGIVVRSQSLRTPLPVASVASIRLRAKSYYAQVSHKPAVSVADSLVMTVRTVRFTYWSTDGNKLVGEDEDLKTTTTTIAHALLASASGTFVHRVRLTAFARSEFADPWDFFSEPQTIAISAVNPVASTRLLVSNIEWEVVEKPSVTRTLREDEIVVTADVRGITDGGLLESPEDVITHVLTDEDNGWGLPGGDVDTAGLATALAGRGNWKFARWITEQTLGKTLLAQACRDAKIEYAWESGKVRFVGDLFPGVEDVDATAQITRAQIMSDLAKNGVHQDLIVNRIVLNFKRDTENRGEFLDFVEQSAPITSTNNAGVLQKTIEADWIRDNGTAGSLAGLILEEYSTPFMTVPITLVAMWGIHLELGDAVSVTDSGARLSNVPCAVVGRRNPRGTNCSFALSARNLRVRLWTATADDTTYIDVLHGSKMIFVIEGVRVAILTQDADWLAKGGFVSTGAALGLTQTDQIEKVGTSIYLGSDLGNPSRDTSFTISAAGLMTAKLLDDQPQYPQGGGGANSYIFETFVGTIFAQTFLSVDKDTRATDFSPSVVFARRFIYAPEI